MTATQTLAQTLDRHEAARRAMIDSQLRTSGVSDPAVLARMSVVPREHFVPETARGAAYTDRAIRLAGGGFLPAPLFHGMLLAEAAPTAEDRAILVDGGSGYCAELVRPMVGTLEVVGPEAAVAGKVGTKGATLLLIEGAVEHLPDALARRLGDGARVVTGLVERGVTRLATGRKSGGSVGLLPLAEIGIPRMNAFDKVVGWSF